MVGFIEKNLFQGEGLMLGAGSGSVSPFVPIVGFGLLVALIVLIYYVRYYLRKKRRQNFMDRCQRDGFNYTEESDFIPKCNTSFNITSEGYYHRYSVIVSGEKDGIVFSTLDFFYYVGSKDSGCYRTLCVLSKPGVLLPVFYVRTKDKISDCIGKQFGGQFIDFVEDAVFSEKFSLQGPNEADIRFSFDQKVRTAFLIVYLNDYEFESAGDYLVVSKRGYTDYDGRLNLLSDALTVFSSFIKDENKGNLA